MQIELVKWEYFDNGTMGLNKVMGKVSQLYTTFHRNCSCGDEMNDSINI